MHISVPFQYHHNDQLPKFQIHTTVEDKFLYQILKKIHVLTTDHNMVQGT